VLPRHRAMNETQTVARLPDTLVGLGPPEPREEFGDSAGAPDAPAETLRAWTTSGDASNDAGDPAEELFVPLAPLFPRGISPPFLHGGGALDGPPGRRSVVPMPALWIAAALIAVAAIASMGIFLKDRSPPRPGPVAAGRSPSTTRVVGGPWVLPPSPEVERERPPDVPTEEPRPPFKEPPTPSHRSGPSTSVPTNPKGSAKSSVASDEARIQAIADTVRLDDDAVGPAGREAVEPEEARPGAR
jgi:hypothetical protein